MSSSGNTNPETFQRAGAWRRWHGQSGLGSLLVTVYTDDRMSNWSYYERRGFKRVGTFYDNRTSHYSGTDAYGIIFVLRLWR